MDEVVAPPSSVKDSELSTDAPLEKVSTSTTPVAMVSAAPMTPEAAPAPKSALPLSLSPSLVVGSMLMRLVQLALLGALAYGCCVGYNGISAQMEEAERARIEREKAAEAEAFASLLAQTASVIVTLLVLVGGVCLFGGCAAADGDGGGGDDDDGETEGGLAVAAAAALPRRGGRKQSWARQQQTPRLRRQNTEYPDTA